MKGTASSQSLEIAMRHVDRVPYVDLRAINSKRRVKAGMVLQHSAAASQGDAERFRIGQGYARSMMVAWVIFAEHTRERNDSRTARRSSCRFSYDGLGER